MAVKQLVTTPNAPLPIGPYSVAVKAGGFVFTAGQIALDPATNQLVPGGIEEQTRQALTNLKHVLEAAGTSLENVVKTTVFLMDMGQFPQMNAVYGEFFTNQPPARSTVQVSALPKGSLVEIEVVAAL